MKLITIKKNNWVIKCPECGNNTAFVAEASQVSEDLCNVWVKCRCGFDPTEQNTDYRYEDVWGIIDIDTVRIALVCWNDALKEKA